MTEKHEEGGEDEGGENKTVEDVIYINGEIDPSKVRAVVLKYVEHKRNQKIDLLTTIRCPNNSNPENAFARRVREWFTRQVSDGDVWRGQNKDDVEEFKEIVSEFCLESNEVRDYIFENMIILDGKGTEIGYLGEIREEDKGVDEDFAMPELRDVGIVNDEGGFSKSKLIGSMAFYIKDVDSISARRAEFDKRVFAAEFDGYMYDKFGSEWARFRADLVDHSMLVTCSLTLFSKKEDLVDVAKEKWEFDPPSDQEDDDSNDKPESISGWGEIGNDEPNEQEEDSEDNCSDDSSVADESTSRVPSLSDFGVDDGIRNTVVNADSVEFVKALADEEGKVIDAVITDVPYGQDFDPRDVEDSGIEGDSSVMEAMDINREVFKKLRLCVKKGSPIMTFAGDSCLVEMKDVFEDWYDFKQILVWDKQHIGMSSLEEDAVRWRPSHEYILFAYNGGDYKGNDNRHDGSVLEFKRPHDDRVHPTEKPIEIMRYIIESVTDEGDLVFDPFSGSGVTLDAARQTGRDYLGVEVDPEYYQKINERLSQTTLV